MSGRRARASPPRSARGNIVVLRSFGKFFGLAGLRLGFALAAPPLAARLAALLGPWAVSGPALAVGAQGAGRSGLDRNDAAPARARRRRGSMRCLTGAGLDIVGGTTLFRLARTPRRSELFQHLGRAGILTRVFPDHADVAALRLAGAEPDWRRLQIAMAALRDNG